MDRIRGRCPRPALKPSFHVRCPSSKASRRHVVGAIDSRSRVMVAIVTLLFGITHPRERNNHDPRMSLPHSTSNPPVNSGCGFRSSLKTRNLVTRRKTYDLLRMVSGEPSPRYVRSLKPENLVTRRD